MESASEQSNRQIYPSLIPRCLMISAGAMAVAWGHHTLWPRIAAALPESLHQPYMILIGTVLLAAGVLSLIGAVIGYFYHLRNRQHYTSLGEVGLAVRATAAGLAALILSVVMIGLLFGW